MADNNYLPRNWLNSFLRSAAASDAVRNMLLSQHPGYAHVFTNFLGDALTAEWVAAKTNGTSAAVTVAASKLTLTSGTDDDGYAGQGHSLMWKGDNGFYMESIQALNTVATSKIEIGVSDAHDDAGAVATKATPTATATDFCVLVRDTDDNTDLDLISQKASGVAADAEGVYTVVGGTSFRTEFRGQNDFVSAFLNGAGVGTGNIEGGTLITPWFFAQSRAGTASRILTVDYLLMTGPNGLVRA